MTDAVPAATVVLLRDADQVEVLAVRRTSKIAFGGMWVFPGGRVDDTDRGSDGDEAAARRAAAREVAEECGLDVDPSGLVLLSRWTPPPEAPRRFATWFFVARVPSGDVTVDGGEILEHAWVTPRELLARRDRGEVDLAPPTWVTLHTFAQAPDVDSALAAAAAGPVHHYETRWHVIDGGAVALWSGDAAYPTGPIDAPGPRHRLWMLDAGWSFEGPL